MKDPRQLPLSRRILLGWLCFLAVSPATLLAQKVWTGVGGIFGNNQWDSAFNWSSFATPVATDTVQFNNSTSLSATVTDNQLQQNWTVTALTFNDVDDTFSILNGTGSNTLTLSSGNITRTAGSSGTQTLGFTNLALGANSTMNIDGSGSLVISAVVQNSGAARSVNKTGAGELVLSGANTFSGGLTVTAGTVGFGSNTAAGTGTLTLAGGSVYASGAARTLTNAVSITNNVEVSGTNNLTFSGATALGAATRTITTTNTGLTTFSGTVSGTGGITKDGAGTLVLSGNNTFSGNLAVNAGTLRVQNTKANVDTFLTDARLKATTGAGGTLVLAYTGSGSGRTLGPAANLATASAVVLGLESSGGTFTLGTAGGGTGDLANWGGLQVGPATTATFADNFVFGSTDSLTLLGGTLNLNNTTQTFGTMTVTANSTIDFAGTGSTLNLSNLIIASGITLTVTNWTNAADFFYTMGWAGASYDTYGVAPMNQVVFVGYGGGTNTHWQEFNHEITPVPEPSTYGLLMMFGVGGLVAYRRWRRA